MSQLEVDFGEVETVTDPFAFPEFFAVRVTNVSNTTRALRSNLPQGPFSLSPPLHAIEALVQPRGFIDLGIQFLPPDGRLHLSSVELNAGPGCTATINLRGLGSGSIAFEPRFLDFGFLEPGRQKTLEVKLVNSRRVPVNVPVLRLDSRELQVFSANLPSQLLLPALSSTTFSITAAPQQEDTFTASLFVSTLFGHAETFMQVVGGTPVADVSPRAITVPVVGFSTGSREPSFSERVLRVRNVGTTGASTEAALRVLPPFVRVTALDGGVADELAVVILPTLSSPIARGEELEVLLRLKPTAPGPRSYMLTVFTNDPVQPEHVVTYEADVQALPRCELRIEPQQELVLTARPDGRSQGTISFINQGSTACIVDDLRLTAGTPTSFTLVNAPAQVEVGPGQTASITVGGPRTILANTGELGFHVFNPTACASPSRCARPHESADAPPGGRVPWDGAHYLMSLRARPASMKKDPHG